MKLIKYYVINDNTFENIKHESYGSVKLMFSGGYVNLDNITYLKCVVPITERITYGMSGYIIEDHDKFLKINDGAYIKKSDIDVE